MLTIILFALANALSPHHDWRASTDLSYGDGDRYLGVCVWRYQRPETMSCIDVALTRRPRCR